MTVEIRLLGPGPLLLVDDDEAFHILFRFVFGRADIPNELVCLTNGAACLDYLLAVEEGHAAAPSLILMDINMPVMNGIETVRMIREPGRATVSPSVAMLTNSDNRQDVDAALKAGADQYFVKPFSLSEFVFEVGEPA